MAYRYTDVNTRVVYNTSRGTFGNEGKIAKFWLNQDGTGAVDIGLYSEATPNTPGTSAGSNQLTVQADSMWPEMWDRDGGQDHLWIQVGTASDPGDVYKVYADADQRLDSLDTRVTDLEDTGGAAVLLKANNLSDVANVSTSRTNLGLGNSATRAVGTTTGTVAAGDDVRFDSIPDDAVLEDSIFINVMDHGVTGNGVTDDTAALQAIFDAIPAAAGNEIGGACIWFPKGIYKVDTATLGVCLRITGKPNVTLKGAGEGARIRASTVTADELLRVETCTGFHLEGLLFHIIGTAKIGKAVHYTTTSDVGSAHDGRFKDIKFSCNGAYSRAWDFMTVDGDPVVWSAMAAFGAGHVGGNVSINLTNGLWQGIVQSVATPTAVLAADIASTSATSVSLVAPLSGTPSSGFTVTITSLGVTERMLVTAGGTTTTLTVSRGRGSDGIKTTHAAGSTLRTYGATLDSNAPSSTNNATAPGRIQAASPARMDVGLAIGTDHPGSPDLDIAGTRLSGVIVAGAQVAGIQVGNATTGDVLDQWALGCSVSQSMYGVYLTAGSLSLNSFDFSTNVIDIRRFQPVSQPMVIHDIRSEGPAMFYEYTGAATGGPPTTINTTACYAFNAEDGVPFRHLNSGSLAIFNADFSSSHVISGTVLASIAGTSSFPCHVFACNVGFSGGNSHFFSSLNPLTSVLTVIGNPRLSTAGNNQPNSAIGFFTTLRTVLGAGFAKTRTAVSDVDYTALTTDITVAYTALTAARVITLPAQALLTAGQEFTVKDESGSCDGTKTLTISPPTGTLDGAASVVLNSAYAKTTVYTNGTNWFTR